MIDADPPGERDAPAQVEFNHTGGIAVALVAGGLLAITARIGATDLLVAIAAVQAIAAFAWVFGTRLPGRKGGLVIAALAAAGADVTVSVWPHSRLGTLLAVVGLAVPVMFVHQLMRGAARVKVVASLGGVALLVIAEVSLPALLQLRHEFGQPHGGQVASGVAAAAAGALIVGYLVDLVVPAPRFDPLVPRGLLGVVAAAGLGGSIGYLALQSDRYTDLSGGRGAFIGASLGSLVALFAVAASFIEHGVAMPQARGAARRLRPVLGAVMPMCLLAPVAFLLCLAIRA